MRARSSYEFLRRDPVRGYRDAGRFVELVEEQYVRDLDEEVRSAMGLVKAGSHVELFERYLKHVSAWTKREKLIDKATGKLADADVDLMKTMIDEGKIANRLWVMLRVGNEALAANLAKYRTIDYADGFLTVRAIKRSIDGALGPRGATAPRAPAAPSPRRGPADRGGFRPRPSCTGEVHP